MRTSDKHALGRRQSIVNAHALGQAKTQQRLGQAVVPSPSGQGLLSAVVLKQALPSGSSPISKLRRSGQSSLHRPPTLQPVCNGFRTTADDPSPFAEVLPLSSELDHHVRLRVRLLLSRGGPSTVSGHVALGAVDAVNRAPLRALTHVGEEVRECQPAVAYGDAASAIAGKGRVRLPSAPADHVGPSRVGRALRALRGVTVHAKSLPSYKLFGQLAGLP